MKLRDLHAKALTQAQSAEVEVSSLPQSSAPRPETQQLACSFCGMTEGTWLFNRGTCWAQFICRGCQNRVTMPTQHLCDPMLPPTAPCQGQERPHNEGWPCPHCGNPAVVEEVCPSLDSTRMLTLWHCDPCQTYGVTADTLQQPPVWVLRTEQ